MPGRDGTGPTGTGPMTGRGLEICNSEDLRCTVRGRLGLARRHGIRGGFGSYLWNSFRTETKEQLMQEKKLLEDRIEDINEKLKQS